MKQKFRNTKLNARSLEQYAKVVKLESKQKAEIKEFIDSYESES